MAKCLYFRQAMSSNEAVGLGGDQKASNDNTKGESKPPHGLVVQAGGGGHLPGIAAVGPSPRLTTANAPSTSLVNSSDLSSLSLGDLSSNETIFAGMELELDMQQQQQTQQLRCAVMQQGGSSSSSSSAQRHQPGSAGLFGVASRTPNVIDSELSLPQVPTTVPSTSSASMLNDWNPYAETPSLAEAILETEFLVSTSLCI